MTNINSIYYAIELFIRKLLRLPYTEITMDLSVWLGDHITVGETGEIMRVIGFSDGGVIVTGCKKGRNLVTGTHDKH